MLVRGCHAPVFDARGRQKCVTGLRPAEIGGWKTGGSGTLGFILALSAVHFGLRFLYAGRFHTMSDRKKPSRIGEGFDLSLKTVN